MNIFYMTSASRSDPGLMKLRKARNPKWFAVDPAWVGRSSLDSCLTYLKLCLQVSVSTLDVSNRQQAREILQSISATSHVGGIFHLAMRLRDKLLSNQVRTRNPYG